MKFGAPQGSHWKTAVHILFLLQKVEGTQSEDRNADAGRHYLSASDSLGFILGNFSDFEEAKWLCGSGPGLSVWNVNSSLSCS